MQYDFTDKVALVTGGSAGIGRSAAVLFAQYGAKVVVAARRTKEGEEVIRSIRQVGGDAAFVKTNIARSGEVKTLLERTMEVYGRVDYALNSAGVFLPDTNTVDLDEQDWDRIIDTNLKGTWLSMKYEIPRMIEQGGGSIVNVGSVTSFWAGPTAYTTSKHGLIGLTKATAKQFAGKGVRVNAICPGVVESEMSDAYITSAELRDQWIGRHPIGRLGTTEDIAKAVVWLCSDAASFVTGHALVADGGFLL